MSCKIREVLKKKRGGGRGWEHEFDFKDNYLVTKVKLDPGWSLNFPVDFWTFMGALSVQMLEYDPLRRKYIGDDAMYSCTKQWKKDRSNNGDDLPGKKGTKRKGQPTAAALLENQMVQEFNDRAKKNCGKNLQLGGELCRLDEHLRSIKISMKYPQTCNVCGGNAYSICGICGVPLHYIPAEGKHVGMIFLQSQ